MRGMPNISVERRLVIETHDAAECVAFAAGRNVGANVSLKKAGNLSLEGGNVFRGLGLLLFGGVGLPLECEYVEDGRGLVFR